MSQEEFDPQEEFDTELVNRCGDGGPLVVKQVLIDMAMEGKLCNKLLAAIWEGREIRAVKRLKKGLF